MADAHEETRRGRCLIFAMQTASDYLLYPVSRAQRAVLQGPRTALAAHIRYKLDTFKCNRREGEKADVSEHIPLHTTQGHHFVKKMRVPASDGRQQLAVKAADGIAEGVPLDWVRVDLQGVALQRQDEDAPAT